MSVTTFTTPASVVTPPARTPLPYGLFSVLSFGTDAAQRWQGGGVTWTGDTCGPADGIGAWFCAPDGEDGPTGLPKNLDSDTSSGTATPFTVYGHWSCTPVGYTLAEAQDKANRHLLAREQQRVEQAVWTGDLGNTPNFRQAVDVVGSPQSVGDGLAYLEYVLGTEFGSMGTIHMTRGMALLGEKYLESRGGRLYTKVGTAVVAGGGYDGSGPTGSPATGSGQSWAYATPTPFGYRSEVFDSSARPGDLFDTSNNNLTAVAERSYVIGWENCGVAAVLLDLNLNDGGGA